MNANLNHLKQIQVKAVVDLLQGVSEPVHDSPLRRAVKERERARQQCINHAVVQPDARPYRAEGAEQLLAGDEQNLGSGNDAHAEHIPAGLLEEPIVAPPDQPVRADGLHANVRSEEAQHAWIPKRSFSESTETVVPATQRLANAPRECGMPAA